MYKYFLCIMVFLYLSTSSYRMVAAYPIDNRQLMDEIVPKTDYAIYLIWGTMPILYTAMHMQLHQVPSILWAQREEHFNLNYLPANIQIVHDRFLQEGTLEKEIDALIQKNPNATYTLYITDTMAGWAVTYYFLSKGVELSSIKIEFLSDGAGTANLYDLTYSSHINASELFDTHCSDVKKLIAYGILDPESINKWSYHYLYAFSKLLNARIWLNHSTNIFSHKNIIDQLNFFEISFKDFYQAISLECQRNFELLMNFNREEFDVIMSSDGGNKPAIVVIGSWMSDKDGYRSISPTFHQDVKNLVTYFGDGYEYFFKGHPELPKGNAEERRLMNDLGFKNLPNVYFPFELLLLIYPNLIVGGYTSSVFITADQYQLRFVFGPINAQPMRALYQQNTWPNIVHF